MTHRRKLIEVSLPLDEINAQSAREKSIRHGHPSTLHLWWARRPPLADDTFWIAEGYDEATGDFFGLAGPGDDLPGGVAPDMYVVRPELGREQRAREDVERKETSAPAPESGGDSGCSGTDAHRPMSPPRSGPSRATPSPAPAPIRNVRYTARFSLDADDIEGSFEQIAEEIITQLLDAGPDLLDVAVTIKAEHREGFDESVARAVSENARTLDADASHFDQG